MAEVSRDKAFVGRDWLEAESQAWIKDPQAERAMLAADPRSSPSRPAAALLFATR